MKSRILPNSLTIKVVITILVTAIGCSSESRVEDLLAKANQHFSDGELRKAEIEYKNVLQADSRIGEAAGNLGLIYFGQGRIRLALPFLSQATEINPDEMSYQGPLLSIKTQFEDPEKTWSDATEILKEDPTNQFALSVLQSSSLRLGRTNDARNYLNSLLVNGESVAIQTALALIDASEGKLDAAIETLKLAIETDPKYATAHLAMGNVLWAKQDLTAADTSFALAAEHSSGRPNVTLTRAQFKLKIGDRDQAEIILKDLIDKNPKFVPALIFRANMLFADGLFEDALEAAEFAQRLSPMNPEITILASQLDLKTGESEAAISRLSKLTQRYPEFAAGHLALSKALLANDERLSASSSIMRVLTLDPNNIEALLVQAGLEIQQGSPEAAEENLLRVLESVPKHPIAQGLLADVYTSKNDYDQALELLLDLSTQQPKNPQPLFKAAQLKIQLGRIAEGRKYLESSLSRAPAFLPPLELILQLDVQDQQFQAAEARLAPLRKENPENPSLHFLSGKLYLAQNKTEMGVSSLKRALEIDPLLRPASYALAQHYQAVGNLNEAKLRLEALIRISKEDVEAIFSLGTLEEQSLEFSSALESYRDVLRLDSNHVGALNNLAYLLADKFDRIEEAHTLALKARELDPSNPAIADTLGWIAFKMGDFSLARSLLEESSRKIEAPMIFYHLAKAYAALDMIAEAKIALDKAINLGLPDEETDDARALIQNF